MWSGDEFADDYIHRRIIVEIIDLFGAIQITLDNGTNAALHAERFWKVSGQLAA